ncbi:type II secretion system F family protein [Eubacterium oxidoreducens]|uniref:Tight adherence protein B n=1 Tax=Eubacterium oxidoreducens TaxID=1732 RepID=A0A1G5ZZY3_EUBOX|nr:type II secretion system F family protein [Eubacterium oxidoreducens]SDB01722.1 tight adherence protein B [Eubacterium oxidoreducens]
MGKKTRILSFLEGIGISVLVALICYRSIWGMAVGIVIIPMWYKFRMLQYEKKRLDKMRKEFQEAMQSVSGALYAGYSLENAWKSARNDLFVIYGEETQMIREMDNMLKQLSLGRNFGIILREFGERSGLDEVKVFCQVMEFAMKSGGDFAGMIGACVRRISDRYEVQREIDTITAEKQLEYRIMMLVPIGIIVYISMSSPGYLDAMYETLQGRCVMTACLAGYAGAVYLAERLIKRI